MPRHDRRQPHRLPDGRHAAIVFKPKQPCEEICPGQLIFPQVEEISPDRLVFPQVFLDDPDLSLKTAAINCAHLYNGSVHENQSSTTLSDWLARSEILSIVVFSVATGIASTVESDKAKRHYTAIALGSAAVTSGLLAFDNLLKFRARAVEELNIAEKRLVSFQRAAHLLQCANGPSTCQPDSRRGDGGTLVLCDEENLLCGRLLISAAFQFRDVHELRDRARVELQNCISIGHPTPYGALPPVPK